MSSGTAIIQEVRLRFEKLRDDCSRVRDRVDSHVQRQIDQLNAVNMQHKQHLDKDESESYQKKCHQYIYSSLILSLYS